MLGFRLVLYLVLYAFGILSCMERLSCMGSIVPNVAADVTVSFKCGKVMLYMSSGKAFKMIFQYFAVLYGTFSMCCLVVVFISFIIFCRYG